MDGTTGYDAVIVCTSNIGQEKYWQGRLEATLGQAAKEGALILAVHEDWGKDGAGNGLGTLYAYTKARAKAKELGVDLDEKLQGGWAVAIFHTAGKGTRLAPLPGSENNNKPGVKLVSTMTIGREKTELTILEAVIRQTNSYAPYRKGRCSVFWGDQIFVPSAGTPSSGAHHADILACLGEMPTAEQWAERGLEKYGLIAVAESGEATQVEKVSHATAMSLLSSFGPIKKVGPSLGSFSISAALLLAMLEEFAVELEGKAAKLDSDPHFWMPLTLSAESYGSIMTGKGVAEADSTAHYARMSAFKTKFLEANPGPGLFGCIDAGSSSYWWDYGMLKLYRKNNMLVTQDSKEAAALRTFLRITDKKAGSTIAADVDEESVVLGSDVRKGTVRCSVCASVIAGELDVKDCLLVNVTAKKIKAQNCVLYNITDDSDEGLEFPDGAVRADVIVPGQDKLVVKSHIDTDGGKVWKQKLEGNAMSFEEVYFMNADVDISEAQRLAKQAAKGVSTQLR
uniref:Uncharacterized protein n=1 Tax=Eutreptiella gymnastica TaxID=73025 RepID=A0A7S4GK83_9EUGL